MVSDLRYELVNFRLTASKLPLVQQLVGAVTFVCNPPSFKKIDPIVARKHKLNQANWNNKFMIMILSLGAPRLKSSLKDV